MKQQPDVAAEMTIVSLCTGIAYQSCQAIEVEAVLEEGPEVWDGLKGQDSAESATGGSKLAEVGTYDGRHMEAAGCSHGEPCGGRCKWLPCLSRCEL